jgi:hypothetical protein
MPEEITPVEFKAVIEVTAERFNLVEHTLVVAVREQLVAQLARELVGRIIAGEVAPPEQPTAGTWGK